jgi:hypothetical protein
MKTSHLYLMCFLLVSADIMAQVPAWAWAKGCQGASENVGQSICADPNGNVYVAGYFSADTLILGTDTLFNRGTGNGFLVKYSPSGNVIWARSAGGTGYDIFSGVCTDANGNVYVTGDFVSPAFVISTDTLINSGSEDVIIAKYDSSGNVIWAHSAGGSGGAYGSAVSADAHGSVYVTGSFYIPGITFGSTTLTNSGSGSNVFTVKYDAGGNVIWAKSSNGSSSSVGTSVSTDPNSNVFISGYFSGGTVIFGSNTLTNIGSSNSADFFIAKYDSSGNVSWAQSSTGTGNAQDNNYSVCTDASGNAYATGIYENNVIVFGNDTVSNTAFYSAYIVKYSPSGQVLWARGPGGGDYNEGLSVAADAAGNVYLAGAVDTAIIFGTDTLATSDEAANIFVAKYNASGTPVWAISVGGADNTGPNSINTDASGNIYLTGYIDSGSVAFGTNTLFNNNTGSQNLFVAKLGNNCILAAPVISLSGVDTLSTTSYTTYQWLLNGTAISSATGQSYIAGSNGNYQVSVTNASGCSDTSAIYTLTGLGLATISVPLITIHPNPSSGDFYFEGVQSGYEIEVYDIFGEMVYSAQADATLYHLSLSGHAKGIYFYKVMDTASTFVQSGKIALE